MPVRALIFDIGGVIVRVNLKRALGSLGGEPAADSKPVTSPQAIWAAIQSDPRWHDWQEGRVSPRQWHQHITARLGLALDFDDFCAAWNRALEPETILPDALFASLATRYQMALLSNTDPLHAAHIGQHFPFVRHFPVRVYSCSITSRKPSPAAYLTVLDALQLPPAEALYIDDIEEFCQAARQLGLAAIRFENPAQLTAEFTRRRILPGTPDDPARGPQAKNTGGT